MSQRKILVTSALLYANGPLHLGHMVEQIQTDIWVRFQRLFGNDCIYVCGEDAHGTPIMLSAEKRSVAPEILIEEMGKSHRRDIKDFLISVDNYHTTHSEENKKLSEFVYQKLVEKGDIITKTVEQAYDPVKEMFLPDRYVKGECPSCGALDQYGDNCENCGASYTPAELKNPYSSISGAKPIYKESLHYFFQLNRYEQMLTRWIKNGHLQPEVANKLQEWLKSGLEPWDISRDEPYFGFKIPGTINKYFYVWLDAPIGYIASFQNLCNRNPELNFADYWQKNSSVELYHFVGKDIIYFHGLFWPAMLTGADFRTPTAIFTHGFLTIDGQKMSKSRGTFIKARTYLDHFDPEYLRYYFTAKSNSRSDDIDLSFSDFMQRVNADLVGKIVNIASRSAAFIQKKFAGRLASELNDPKLFSAIAQAKNTIAELYETREYSQVTRKIMELADRVNQYIDDKKPWILVKDEIKATEVQSICTTALNCFRQLMIYLKPVLPQMTVKVENFLNCDTLTWEDLDKPLLNHSINVFTPLMQRIEESKIEALKEQAKAETDV